MRTRSSLLLIALSCCPLLATATQTAQVRLYCGSIQFERAEWVTGETADLTSTFPVLNKEMQPYFGTGTFDYGGLVQLTGFDSNPFLLGSVGLDLAPIVDVNTNKYPDFFEVAMEVPETVTEGSFLLPMGGGAVQATWSRQAGSATGVCQLVYTFDLGQPPMTFTHQFTLIEYNGTLSYTSGSNSSSGTLTLVQAGFPTNTLHSTLHFTKPVPNPGGALTLLAGAWTNNESQTISFPAVGLNHLTGWPTNFSGLLEADDGQPATIAPDYRWWIISIDDPDDTDADGIPDLADSPPVVLPRAPVLSLALVGTNLGLTISGDIGHNHIIQATEALQPTNWQPVETISLSSDPQTVLVPLPATDTSFWRVIAQ